MHPHREASWLDGLPRPSVRLGRRLVPIYLLMGIVACWTGGLVTLIVALASGIPASLACLVVLLSIAGMLTWVAVRRRLTRREAFIAIENLFAAFLPVGALDLALGAGGVLVDVQALGLGTFMVFGRLGCFLNGCCYGAPSDLGVCYQHGHHDPSVRRFPAQLVASGGWVLLVAGGLVAWGLGPPGSTLACMLIGYGPLRLANEFLRGDPRPRILGWTTGSIGAVLLWVIGVLLAPGGVAWVALGTSALVVAAVFTSGRWLVFRQLDLPEPWDIQVSGARPEEREWAGYVLVASVHDGELWLSVSAGERLLGPAEADAVLTHHGMVDPTRLAPGVFVGRRRLAVRADTDVDYLERSVGDGVDAVG